MRVSYKTMFFLLNHHYVVMIQAPIQKGQNIRVDKKSTGDKQSNKNNNN